MQEYLDFASYLLNLSYSSYDLTQHLDGQPLQVVCCVMVHSRFMFDAGRVPAVTESLLFICICCAPAYQCCSAVCQCFWPCASSTCSAPMLSCQYSACFRHTRLRFVTLCLTGDGQGCVMWRTPGQPACVAQQPGAQQPAPPAQATHKVSGSNSTGGSSSFLT
jgi:hypothetical protein